MNEDQKAKLATLRAKAEADLSDPEKAELTLLVTIEKQAKQITEKDTLIGTKGTELETLKKDIEGKTGKEKEALEAKLADKEEALKDLKEAHEATKEAHEATKAAAKISPEKPGHGDAVDPKEVEALETKAQSDPATKLAVEELYKGLEPADKLAYKNDPEFRKLCLETVVDPEGDDTDDTPWATKVKKEETAETASERMTRLFDKTRGNHRRLPHQTSGRGGRGGKSLPGMPQARERVLDNTAQ